MCETIVCRIDGGFLVASKSCDPDYPGIDIEFVADEESEDILSRPRVLVEKPLDGKLRILVWNDKKCEDYTDEIELE